MSSQQDWDAQHCWNSFVGLRTKRGAHQIEKIAWNHIPEAIRHQLILKIGQLSHKQMKVVQQEKEVKHVSTKRLGTQSNNREAS